MIFRSASGILEHDDIWINSMFQTSSRNLVSAPKLSPIKASTTRRETADTSGNEKVSPWEPARRRIDCHKNGMVNQKKMASGSAIRTFAFLICQGNGPSITVTIEYA